MMTLPAKLYYIRYLLAKPSHSARHKILKKKSSLYAKNANLYEIALRELSEFTHEDFKTIEERYKSLCEAVAHKDFDSLNDKELLDFYSNAQHYLYELPIWNAASGRIYYFSQLLIPYLKSQQYKDILDFGAGAGDLCLGLARHGFNMYYSDINKKLKEFAKWRFEKNMLNVQILDNKHLDIKKFDCVVSLDVFEHFKNLPEKIKQISSMIKTGGGLIFNIELSGDGLHLKENKIYTDHKRLDRILKENNLGFHWRFKRIYFYKKR